MLRVAKRLRVALCLWVALSSSCTGSEGADRGPLGTATGGSGASGGMGGSGGAGGSSGAAAAGAPSPRPDGGGGAGSGPVTPSPKADAGPLREQQCASASYEAQQTPLDMYIVLDASGSMSAPYWTAATPSAGDCNVGDALDSRWCFTINALSQFFSAPESAGMRVALQFFNRQLVPMVHCTTGGPVNTPAVALGELPAATPALTGALNAAIPVDGTPTEAAIRGLVNYTAASKAPDREMVGVLITDGAPSDCNADPAFLASLAQAHFAGTGIRTFAIGMEGANFDVLETLAVGGAAAEHADYCANAAAACHYYDVGMGNGSALIDALRAITLSAIGCELDMPEDEAGGGTIDPNKVNVAFTAGDGTPHDLVKVDSPADCMAWAWHYDDEDAPTALVLCPETCEIVGKDGAGKLDIVIGCETRTPQ